MLSVAVAARSLAAVPRRRLWAAAQGVMALGTALPVAVHALWAVVVSALLVGGTFMIATMAGLQLAREARPDDPTPLLARMTAAFAAGQIAGPLVVRALDAGGRDGLGTTGAVAACLSSRSPPCGCGGPGAARLRRAPNENGAREGRRHPVPVVGGA